MLDSLFFRVLLQDLFQLVYFFQTELLGKRFLKHLNQNFNKALFSEDLLPAFIGVSEHKLILNFPRHSIKTKVVELFERPVKHLHIFFENPWLFDAFMIIDDASINLEFGQAID